MQIENIVTTGIYAADSEMKKREQMEFAELLKVQEAKDIIYEITSGGMQGMWEWQVEELRKKIASDVMAEMNVTEESIAKMGIEDRMAIQKKIMDEVQKRLEVIMAEAAKENQKEGKNELGTTSRMYFPMPGGPDKSSLNMANDLFFMAEKV